MPFGPLNDRVYTVGGCVRDEIMGIKPHDIDYVMEKTTPEQFREVFPCKAKQKYCNDKKWWCQFCPFVDAVQLSCKDCEVKCGVPRVGESFPVYLVNGEEVALARTEEKTGDKYQDFSVVAGVSIEEDLKRRDFTINSIAKKLTTGAIVDPYGGVEDIHTRLLRCVNPVAFTEDPLRIYRGMRFAAKYNLVGQVGTVLQMKSSIGNLIHVNPERVYAELKKVYESCEKPSMFFFNLEAMGGLKIHFKPLYVMTKVPAGPVKWHGNDTAFEHAMHAFDYAKSHNYSFDVALAALFHDTGKGITPKHILPSHHFHENRSYAINKQFVKQHRFTSKQEDMIVNFGLVHMKFHFIEQMNPTRLIRFYKSIKKYADEYIQCANCDAELNENQLRILDLVKRAIKETPINVPKDCKEAAAFVESKYAHTLKSLLKE